ncbi:MAG: short-chain dehydrogenase [Parcubacteria group bacterium Gr01-1014_91]|nr:MAG: short-chain dehydrogenase [Parcubacteria group bacterium Gr01-1014_91]
MLEKFSLDGKVAIVTGAARGNGKGIAEGLLGAGATVYFVDKLKTELEETVHALKNEKAKMIVTDLSVREDLEKIAPTVFKNEGRIDILVNNAGITAGAPSESHSEEDWDRVLFINLKAPFLLSQKVANIMIEKGEGGSIINITSLGAELGLGNVPGYTASKGGLKQLTKTLAFDWAKYNIRVNNIGPGYMRTDMTKRSYATPELKEKRDNRIMLGRWGEPEDLAGPAIFLASDASAYITGQDIYVDGGWLAKGV